MNDDVGVERRDRVRPDDPVVWVDALVGLVAGHRGARLGTEASVGSEPGKPVAEVEQRLLHRSHSVALATDRSRIGRGSGGPEAQASGSHRLKIGSAVKRGLLSVTTSSAARSSSCASRSSCISLGSR